MPKKNITSISRFHIISIFILGSVGAVFLILSAVYKGASDYAIKNAIQRNFDIVSAKTEMAFSRIGKVLNEEQFMGLVQNIPADQWLLFAVTGDYPEIIQLNNIDLKLPVEQFQSTEQNSAGGYFERQGFIYIWNLLAIEDQLYPVLSVAEFTESENDVMLSVFSNRLIIPSIFIVWLTVWGALVLSRLLGRLYEQGATLEKYVTIDPLTGLRNQQHAREIIEMHLSKAFRHNRHLAGMLVLFENNDQLSKDYGQQFSNTLIQLICQRMKDTLRAYDHILRYRDNVFMVLLADETQDNAARVEQRLHEDLARPYVVYGHSIQPGIAIELVCYPDQVNQTDEFIKECNRRIEHRLKTVAGDAGVLAKESNA